MGSLCRHRHSFARVRTRVRVNNIYVGRQQADDYRIESTQKAETHIFYCKILE